MSISNLPRVVGFTGYGTSGKDEAYLQGLKSRGYKRLAFAGELKEEVARAFQVTTEEINEDKDMWRPMLVCWGETRRRQKTTYWIDKLFNQMDPKYKYCITDVRYGNEYAEIIKRYGRVYLIDNPEVGPANETEGASIAEIVRIFNPVKIVNDATKEILGDRVWHTVSSNLRKY